MIVWTLQSKAAVWKLRQDFYITVLRQNSFLYRKMHLLLKSSTNWMNPTHLMEDHLLFWNIWKGVCIYWKAEQRNRTNRFHDKYMCRRYRYQFCICINILSITQVYTYHIYIWYICINQFLMTLLGGDFRFSVDIISSCSRSSYKELQCQWNLYLLVVGHLV